MHGLQQLIGAAVAGILHEVATTKPGSSPGTDITPAQVRADQCRLDQNATADPKLARNKLSRVSQNAVQLPVLFDI
jgi:hypothetical protein